MAASLQTAAADIGKHTGKNPRHMNKKTPSSSITHGERSTPTPASGTTTMAPAPLVQQKVPIYSFSPRKVGTYTPGLARSAFNYENEGVVTEDYGTQAFSYLVPEMPSANTPASARATRVSTDFVASGKAREGASSFRTGIIRTSHTDEKMGSLFSPASSQGLSIVDLPLASGTPTSLNAVKATTPTLSTIEKMPAPPLLDDNAQEGSALRPHPTTAADLASEDLVVSNVLGAASSSVSSVTRKEASTTDIRQVTSSNSGGVAASRRRVARSRAALRRISDYNSGDQREILSRKAKRSRSTSIERDERGSKRRVMPAVPHNSRFGGKEILTGLGMDSEIDARRVLEAFLQYGGVGNGEQCTHEATTGGINTAVKTENGEGRLDGKNNTHASDINSHNLERETIDHGGITKHAIGTTAGTQAGRSSILGGYGADQTIASTSGPSKYRDGLTNHDFVITDNPVETTGSATGAAGDSGPIPFTAGAESGTNEELFALLQSENGFGGGTAAAKGWSVRAAGGAEGERGAADGGGSGHSANDDRPLPEDDFLSDKALGDELLVWLAELPEDKAVDPDLAKEADKSDTDDGTSGASLENSRLSSSGDDQRSSVVNPSDGRLNAAEGQTPRFGAHVRSTCRGSEHKKARPSGRRQKTGEKLNPTERSTFNDSTAGASAVEAYESERDRQLLLAVANVHAICEERDRTLLELRLRSLPTKRDLDDANRAYEEGVQRYTATYNNTAGARQQQNNAYYTYTTATYRWEILKTNVANLEKQDALDAEVRRATDRLVHNKNILDNVQIQLDEFKKKFLPPADQGNDGGLRGVGTMCAEHGDLARTRPRAVDVTQNSGNKMLQEARGRLDHAVNLAVESVNLARSEEKAAQKVVVDNLPWVRLSDVRGPYAARDARDDFSRATAELNHCFHQYKVAEAAATLANTRLLEAEMDMKQRQAIKNSTFLSVQAGEYSRARALDLANLAHCKFVEAKNALNANHSDPDRVNLSSQALEKVIRENATVGLSNSRSAATAADTAAPAAVSTKRTRHPDVEGTTKEKRKKSRKRRAQEPTVPEGKCASDCDEEKFGVAKDSDALFPAVPDSFRKAQDEQAMGSNPEKKRKVSPST